MTPSPSRRVIPTGYQVCLLTFHGETPLLMSNGEVDRDSDTYVAYRTLGSKRAKSLDDEARLRELEWHTRLYYDNEIGCYIPGKNVKELIRSAATKWKKGEDVKRSLVVPEYRIPLIYTGPRTAAELWAEGFRYTAMVANAGAGSGRVQRCRPCFDEWSLQCEIAFDPTDLDLQMLQTIVERTQKYGLGDYRPEFGAFTATLELLREHRENARADAHKPRDTRAEKTTRKKAAAILTTT